MGTLTNIQSALEVKLATLSPAVSTAWPNVKHIPTENTAWMRGTLLPIRSTLETLTSATYHKGIYQVDVFVPLEKGEGALLTILDGLYILYRKTNLTASSTVVEVKAVSRGPTIREEAWLHGMLEIEFQCFDF